MTTVSCSVSGYGYTFFTIYKALEINVEESRVNTDLFQKWARKWNEERREEGEAT